MIPSDIYYLKGYQRCSGYNCGTSSSGKFNATYKYAYLHAECTPNCECNLHSGASVHLYDSKGLEVEGDYPLANCPSGVAYCSPKRVQQDWDILTPGETYSWSASSSGDRCGIESRYGIAYIQEYEQGYKLIIKVKNKGSVSRTLHISIQVTPVDNESHLGTYSSSHTLAPGETINVSPIYTNGRTFPTAEYAVDRLDSSNKEYYVYVLVEDYLYRAKVKWTPDGLQILEPLGTYYPKSETDMNISSATDIEEKCSLYARTYVCAAPNIYITGTVVVPKEGKDSRNVRFYADNLFQINADASLSAGGERGRDVSGWWQNGESGGSGGSIYVKAEKINIYGVLSTNGGGGGRGGYLGSGGKGGDAGSIDLDATTDINIYAPPYSNGGNGGEGGSYSNGGDAGSGGTITLRAQRVFVNATLSIRGGRGGYPGYLGNTGRGGPAGTLTIDADEVEIRGNIDARGGDAASTRWGGSAGGGGTVTVNSDRLVINGNVSVNGGNGGGGKVGASGGVGGKINLISDSEIVINGYLNAAGGTGGSGYESREDVSCTGFGGRGGDGGSVIIRGTNVSINNPINVNGANGGWGNGDAQGGAGGNGGVVDIQADMVIVNSSISANGGNGGGFSRVICACDRNAKGGNAGKIKISANSYLITSTGRLSSLIGIGGKGYDKCADGDPLSANISILSNGAFANQGFIDSSGTVDLTLNTTYLGKISCGSAKIRYCYDPFGGSTLDVSRLQCGTTDIARGSYCPFAPEPTIEASYQIYDTSRNAWVDYGDVFVLPTKDIRVRVNAKNLNYSKSDWKIGVRFFKIGKFLEVKESVTTWVSKNTSQNCTLVSEPNNNGVFDANETFVVECWAPASTFGLVPPDVGGMISIKAYEGEIPAYSIPKYLNIYTFTKKREPCRYEYYRYSKYGYSDKIEEYPVNLEGVGCGTSFFYKLDTFEYYEPPSLVFWQQTQEFWYGPAGYKACGMNGREAVSLCANYRYSALCLADNTGCFAKLSEECIAADTNPDPYDVYCSYSSSYPKGYSITREFCPSGTICASDGGCYPLEYILPSIKITYPKNNQTVYTEMVVVNGTAYDERGISIVEVSVNGEPFEPASGTDYWEKTVTLRPGPNVIVVRATNTLGVTANASIIVNRGAPDMTPPNVTIVYPGMHQKFETNNIVLKGNASDNRGIREVRVKLNYGGWEPAEGTSSWSKSLTLRYGANRITVRAIDTSGNIAEASIVVYYYIPVFIPQPPPPAAEEPGEAPTTPSTTTGSVTGVTGGLFNFTTSYEELVEAMNYQREILDGTHLLAGINVTYEEVLYGEAEPITPPNYTVNNTLVWTFPEIENGETISILYNVSFALSALEKRNISKARISYIDGVTLASVVREFPPLQVEALNLVSLSINTSRRVYSPYDTIELVGTVSNNGNSTLSNLTLRTFIDTPTGEKVSVPPLEIPVHPPSSNLSFSLPLNNTSVLAPGNYTVVCTLVGELNVTLANATTSFEMTSVIGAEMSLFTDKGVYIPGETVDAFVKINNTSPNTPLEDSYVEFLLTKRNSTLSRWVVNVSAIASGEVRYVHSYFIPRNGSGEYLLNATLRLRNGTVLATASKSFWVVEVPHLVVEESLSTYATRALKPVNASLTVRNTGGSAAVNTSLLALLPENFTALSYAGDYNGGTNTITWQLGDIASEGSAGINYTFLTPFIHSFDPVNYTIRAKVFYLDYYGRTYVSSVEKKLLVKPIPLLKGEIITPSVAYSGHSIVVAVNITNLGYDDAVNISARLTLPEELRVQEETLENASYNASSGAVTWRLELPPKEGVLLNLSAEAQLIPEVRNVTLNLSITYYDEDGYAYHNSSSAKVTVIPILVLAWSGDASDEWFVDKASEEIAYVKKVNTTQELMHELRSSNYTVLWLLNMGHCEYDCAEEGELNSTEVEEIKAWLSQGGSLTRELIFSDYTLKANPSLGDIAGFKYVGSLPMGRPHQPREVSITEEHLLTAGYAGANLTTVGWLAKVEPEYTYKILAYAVQGMPGRESYPALTISYYDRSRVIFFAPDIALSSYEGYNASVWLNITRRALLWSLEACESVASLSATKELKPQSGRSAKTRVSIQISSTGSVPAENVTVTEEIPPAFVIDSTDGSAANGSITWSFSALEPRSSRTLEYVLLNPEVSETTTFTLRTLITYSSPAGNETVELVSYLTIEPKKGGGRK